MQSIYRLVGLPLDGIARQSFGQPLNIVIGIRVHEVVGSDGPFEGISVFADGVDRRFQVVLLRYSIFVMPATLQLLNSVGEQCVNITLPNWGNQGASIVLIIGDGDLLGDKYRYGWPDVGFFLFFVDVLERVNFNLHRWLIGLLEMHFIVTGMFLGLDAISSDDGQFLFLTIFFIEGLCSNGEGILPVDRVVGILSFAVRGHAISHYLYLIIKPYERQRSKYQSLLSAYFSPRIIEFYVSCPNASHLFSSLEFVQYVYVRGY